LLILTVTVLLVRRGPIHDDADSGAGADSLQPLTQPVEEIRSGALVGSAHLIVSSIGSSK
jgi:hypothetical protein